jgi:two-component system sensor histidine kinase UhpB
MAAILAARSSLGRLLNPLRDNGPHIALSYPQFVSPQARESDRDRKTRRYVPLVWRVFGLNAAVLVAAVVLTVVILPPHVLSAPETEEEIAILLASLCLMLAVNLFLLRHSFAPLRRLTEVMREVDLLRPGQRVPVEASASEVMELGSTFNEMLDRLETERQESAGRALAAQEGERLRVAQELHDEIGQSLTAVLLDLARAERQAPEELKGQLRATQESVRASLDDARRIALELRPEALDDLGLAAALIVLADRFSGRADIQIEHRIERRLPALSYEQELVVYRVAQEALTNVVRHAGARRAELSLDRNGTHLALRIRDDGRGLPAAPAAGGGIRGMRERALLVRAELSIGERPRGGVEVALDLPVRSPA